MGPPKGETLHRRGWRNARARVTKWLVDTVREHATTSLVAGLVIAATGMAPKEWFARALQSVNISSDALHLWGAHVDLRVAIVFAGVAIIVGDVLWRHHRHPTVPAGGSRLAPADRVSVRPATNAGPGDGSSAPEVLPLPDKPSIAVLSFTNMIGDPDQEYVGDGVAEDIITMLSRSPSLFVIARNSSFTYKGRAVDVKQIGRELGVRYVLEGSVRRAGNRARISAQLIDAVSGNHLWAERYDRDLTDIFAIQDEITEAVVIAIEPAIGQVERHRAVRKPPESLSAWEAYQRGQWHLARLGAAENEAAKSFFRQAIDLDPDFAPAYAQLTFAISLGAALYPTSNLTEVLQEVRPLAQKAVSLDPLDAVARVSAGLGAYTRGDMEAALIEARQALAISPNYATAHFLLGAALINSGQPGEGIEAIRTSTRLDPADPIAYQRSYLIAVGYYFLRDYLAAVDAARESHRSYADHPFARHWLAAALGQLGRADEAREALEQAFALAPGQPRRPPWTRPQDHEHMLEGLRKAGWDG
jgi:adenylate cyclase